MRTEYEDVPLTMRSMKASDIDALLREELQRRQAIEWWRSQLQMMEAAKLKSADLARMTGKSTGYISVRLCRLRKRLGRSLSRWSASESPG